MRFLLLLLLVALATPLVRTADQDWPAELGEAGATHYSPLRQIDRTNVGRLAPVWTFHTGDAYAVFALPGK